MKAIDTKYAGRLFRSRLEARWAVFFDAMGWKWQYEKEGYELPSGWYLPDFWIESIQMWAEVKPKRFDTREIVLAQELSIYSSFPVICLDEPEPKNISYLALGLLPDFEVCWDNTYKAVSAALSARFEHGESGAR